jgi:gliding motility-associated-like protein
MYRLPLYLLCAFLLAGKISAQDAAEPFNSSYWNAVADKRHLSPADRKEFLDAQLRAHEEKRHEHKFPHDSEIIWVEVPNGKIVGGASIAAGPCTNIGFESGNFTGWTRKTGYHPLFNAQGCCTVANGAQAITNGAGTDPYGGFPVVAPGGSFSMRLGNNGTGGVADRIEQTFFVTTSNANFTYRYAVVLNDNGHPTTQQPAFTIEMIDSTGFQVPCTMYTVAAASNISGFFTSSVTGGSPVAPVVYKPWTTVALDLTPNVGQNITIRFTTYDCSQGGHFGYAYIDGSCGSFATSIADTTCPGLSYSMCGPPGFASYQWNGPGVVNTPGQCLSASAAGVYTCTTILVPGCPGPTFTHTLSLLPNPVLSFTPVTTGACATQYTFNSTSSISSGSIAAYTWNFGDNNSTFLQSPAHNYAGSGTYAVKFKAVTDRGCRDSVTQNITIYPFPALSFTPPSNCINTAVQFTNTSTIGVGSIASYTWDLGNNVTSNLVNPTNTYTTNGNYSVTLMATSNQGCTSVLNGSLGIFPPPVVSFSYSNLCFGDATAFTNSTTIASGSLVAFSWNFGDGTSSSVASPVKTFTAAGNYAVSFTATSNHNCISTQTQTVTIHPLPIPSFTAAGVCLNSASSFTNTSTIPAGSLSSYTWNFGDGTGTVAASPVHAYSTAAVYNATLTAVSAQGCLASAVTTVQVYPLPNISFSPPSACVNTSINFTNTSQIASGTIAAYLWNFGNGSTTTSVNPVYTYTSPSTYTVQLTATSDRNCQSSSTTSLTIYPAPSAGFTFSNLCFGSTTTFTNSATITSGSIPFYNWSFGDNSSSNLPNPAHSYSASGSYVVTFTATSNNGCTGIATATVPVYPLPAVAYSVNAVCPGAASSFTNATTLAGGGSLTYSWIFGDGSNSAQTSPVHTYSATGVYSTSLTAVSAQGCVGSATAAAVVHPAPVVAFSPSSACASTPVSFQNNSGIAGGSISAYSWQFGNGFSSTSVSPVHTYSQSGTYVVSLTATSDQGCISGGTAGITVFPLASAAFTFANLCLGSVTSFTSNTSVPSGSVSYFYWDFGDGTGGSGPSASHTYSQSAAFAVTFSAITNNNCLSTATHTFNIHPLPQTSFSAAGVCLNATTGFTNFTSISLTGSNSIVSYNWNFGDGSAGSSIQNPLHTYTAYGSYVPTLTALSNYGCVNTATGNVSVNPLPVVAFSPSSACVNTAVQFTNSSYVATGSIAAWQWNFGDGNTAQSFNPAHTYTTHNIYSVTLTAVSDRSCVTSGTYSLGIHPYPTGTVTPLGNKCINDQVVFAPNIIIPSNMGSGISSYTWNFGDSQFSVVLTPTLPANVPHTYTAYGSFTVYLTALSTENCAATFSAGVNVYPRPFPAFTTSKFCHQDTTAFLDLSTIPSGSISAYNWFFDDGTATSALKVPVHVYTVPGTKTVVLTVSSNPEPGLVCSHSVANTVTIHPLPAPSFAAQGVCHGVATQFVNTSPSAGVVGWSWDFENDGLANSSAFQPAHLYPAPGSYTAVLKAQSTFSCVSTFSSAVSVYTNPAASFTATEVCLGNMTSFSNLSTVGSGNVLNYSWSFAGGGTSSLPSPNHSFTAAGQHTVSLTATSNLGCSSVMTSTVAVNPLPAMQVSSSSVCLGQATQFTNLSQIQSGSITRFVWDYESNGWDDSSSAQGISPKTYPGSGGFIFRLKGISDKGCTSLSTANVRVYALPQADFHHGRICAGDKIVFNSTSTSADGAVTDLLWDFNGDLVPEVQGPDPVYTYSLYGEYPAALTVVSSFGCRNSRSKMVYANPKAVPVFRSGDNSGCPPLCIDFESMSYISKGSFSQKWNFGDLSPAISGSTATHCFYPGFYDVKLELVSDSGCKSEVTRADYVKVFENPVAGFSLDPPEIDENEPMVSISSTAEHAAFTMYFLSDGTKFTGDAFNHQFSRLDGKTKPIIVQVVKSANGCTDTTYKVIEIKPAFAIYFPNVFTPNEDGRNDSFFPKGIGILKFAMQIYDRWGHEVFSCEDFGVHWDGRSKGSAGPIKQDVYTYKAQVVDIFQQNHEYIGHVSLIR